MAVQLPSGVTLAATQRLIINVGAEVQSLDPHKSAGMSKANVIRDCLEGLVNFGIDGQVVPGVAQRWQASAD
ncbi:MAG: hypothetical protein AB2993_06100 [Candidatus Symbiodolus clandestinus]